MKLLSGVSTPRDGLVSFLYVLLRDELPAGAVERVMREHVEKNLDATEIRFSNPYLQAYAEELAARIRAIGPR